jgi:PAS domain S-box-containing protein
VSRPLRLLLVEDSDDDAQLLLRELRHEGFNPLFERVDTMEAMNAALDRQEWDIIISDHAMPAFSSLRALALMKEKELDLPFIIVSGLIGEEMAVEAMKSGAHDYLLKGRLARLGPAVERELREAQVRQARRRSEEALRESEERFRQLAENIEAVFFIHERLQVGALGRLLYVSSGYAKLWGRPRKGLYHEGGSWLNGVHSQDRERVLAELPNIAVGKFDTEFRILRSNRETRWVHFRAFPVQNERAEIYRIAAIAEDITSRKESEQTIETYTRELHSSIEELRATEEELRASNEELASARDEAQAASEAKDQFLAVLSHELRTPLTPILTLASMLRTDKTLPKRVSEMLEIIHRNVQLESHLIEDLLDLTRIRHRKLDLKLARVDIHQSIEATLDVCQTEIEEKKLELVVKLAARRHHVRGDAARLQQLFWNLIQNAVKFTPCPGRITIRSLNRGDEIVVEFADTGVGITRSLLPKVFNAFEQGGHKVTHQYGGLGLGLAISKAVVEAHRGEISARSSGKNLGSIFRVRLSTI